MVLNREAGGSRDSGARPLAEVVVMLVKFWEK